MNIILSPTSCMEYEKFLRDGSGKRNQWSRFYLRLVKTHSAFSLFSRGLCNLTTTQKLRQIFLIMGQKPKLVYSQGVLELSLKGYVVGDKILNKNSLGLSESLP